MAEEIHYLSFDPEKLFEEMHRAYLEAGGEALYPGDEKDMLLRSCQAVITQAFGAPAGYPVGFGGRGRGLDGGG